MANEHDRIRDLYDKRVAAQKEGGMLMLYSLVEDGSIDAKTAAKKAGQSEEEFLKNMMAAGFRHESSDSNDPSLTSEKGMPETSYSEVPTEKTGAVSYTEVSSGEPEKPYTEVPGEDPDNPYTEVPGKGPADPYTEVTPAGSKDLSYAEVPSLPEEKVFGPEDVGLVLSGGGGKGAYQIGVMRALAEEGQLDKVAAVAGTSIGAVNAVLYAGGDFDKAYQTWDDIDMGVLFDFDPAMLAEGKICFSRDEMNRLMNQYIDYDKISAGDLVIYCGVAEELGSDRYRAEYMKLNGKSVSEIQKILMASTALPVVYDAVVIGGKRYRDGGVVDNEPVRPLYDAGIRKFILVNLDYARVFHPEEFPGAEFIVIDPSRDLGDVFTGTLNFSKDDKAIKRTIGYKDGKRAIKVLIEKDPAYIAIAPALAVRDYEETVREYERQKRISALEQSVSSSFDYISELEKKYT